MTNAVLILFREIFPFQIKINLRTTAIGKQIDETGDVTNTSKVF